MKYAILHVTGVIVESGTAQELPAGAIEIDTAIASELLCSCMVVGGVLMPRPASPVPTLTGNVATVTGCPASTRIEVMDVSGGELMVTETAGTDGYDTSFTFADPGTYEITVFAPLPHLPSTLGALIE